MHSDFSWTPWSSTGNCFIINSDAEYLAQQCQTIILISQVWPVENCRFSSLCCLLQQELSCSESSDLVMLPSAHEMRSSFWYFPYPFVVCLHAIWQARQCVLEKPRLRIIAWCVCKEWTVEGHDRFSTLSATDILVLNLLCKLVAHCCRAS